MGSNVKAGQGLFRLEDMVTPEMFFNLGCWTTGKIGSKVLKFTMGEKHMYLTNRLKESGIFRVNYTQMHRGLLSIGLIVESFYNNIYEKKSTNIIQKSRMARQRYNVNELSTAIAYLDKNDDSDDMLLSNYILYGSCQYGAYILNNIMNHAGSSTAPINNTKIKIPDEIKTLCKNFSKEPPNNSRFKLIRSSKNERITILLPNHIKVLVFGLLKKNITNTRLMSDIYRGAYITGLYVLCRWIIRNQIPLNEYMYGRIMHNIYDYLSDHV